MNNVNHKKVESKSLKSCSIFRLFPIYKSLKIHQLNMIKKTKIIHNKLVKDIKVFLTKKKKIATIWA